MSPDLVRLPLIGAACYEFRGPRFEKFRVRKCSTRSTIDVGRRKLATNSDFENTFRPQQPLFYNSMLGNRLDWRGDGRRVSQRPRVNARDWSKETAQDLARR